MKIKAKAVKVYKPEIMICPKCKSGLKYVYTISNRVIQFSSGRVFRIKNMGYKCPNCNDDVFFSLTALKLAFKGYTYSAKIACMIEYYKRKGYTRDRICDLLAEKDIEISDRNVDILYKKVKSLIDMDYDNNIKNEYDIMINKYNEIRICLDLVTIERRVYIILYSYFSGNILALWTFDSVEDDEIKGLLRNYINENYPVSTIVTIRPQFRFYSIIKENVPNDIKIISFSKF